MTRFPMTRFPMTALNKGLALTTVAGVLLLAGCAKDKGASCGEAIANYMSLVDAEQSRDGDRDRRKTARANRPALQNSLLKACEAQKWSLATRKCLSDAKSAADTKTCVPARAEPASEESGDPSDGPQ
jgi:hypothetical protein